MDKKEYIKILTDQIRCRMARPDVARELDGHIEEQTRAFMSTGMNRKEAEEAAVKEMGSPVETGVAMDRIHRPKMPWVTIGLIIILSAASCVFQLLLNEKNIAAGGGGFFDSRRQIMVTVMGILVMTGVCFADYTRIALRAREVMAGLILAIGIGKMCAGVNLNGAERWIGLPGGFSVDLLLLLMLTVPLFAAVLYVYRGKGRSAILRGVLWMIPGCWLALRCGSMWMACVLFLAYLAVIGTAVYRGWYRVRKKAVLAGIAAIVILLAPAASLFFWFFGEPYQKERLLFYLSSAAGIAGEREPQEMISYGMVWVREILGSSRLIGQGGGPDILDMPRLSDFMLCGVAAYYGILVAVLLAVLLLFLLIRLLRASLRQKNQLGMLMGTGCAAVFLIEAVFYFLNNTGIIYMGNYCPFFTYGGTGGIVAYILFGLLLSICRYQNTAPERRSAGPLFGSRRLPDRING